MPLDVPTVFGADEQRDVPVDVARWVRLAQLVLDEERVIERLGADTEMSLLFVDATTIAELNERFLGSSGPTDVLAFPIDDELPPSGRQPDQGGRGPRPPAGPERPADAARRRRGVPFRREPPSRGAQRDRRGRACTSGR